jgi:hypothetical protein
MLGAAFRPALGVPCSGKALRSEDVEFAQRSSSWLNLAYEVLQAGDQANGSVA